VTTEHPAAPLPEGQRVRIVKDESTDLAGHEGVVVASDVRNGRAEARVQLDAGWNLPFDVLDELEVLP
jgi:RNase P/RNase MRP subunit p29